jgi:hypothetical protein
VCVCVAYKCVFDGMPRQDHKFAPPHGCFKLSLQSFVPKMRGPPGLWKGRLLALAHLWTGPGLWTAGQPKKKLHSLLLEYGEHAAGDPPCGPWRESARLITQPGPAVVTATAYADRSPFGVTVRGCQRRPGHSRSARTLRCHEHFLDHGSTNGTTTESLMSSMMRQAADCIELMSDVKISSPLKKFTRRPFQQHEGLPGAPQGDGVNNSDYVIGTGALYRYG